MASRSPQSGLVVPSVRAYQRRERKRKAIIIEEAAAIPDLLARIEFAARTVQFVRTRASVWFRLIAVCLARDRRLPAPLRARQIHQALGYERVPQNLYVSPALRALRAAFRCAQRAISRSDPGSSFHSCFARCAPGSAIHAPRTRCACFIRSELGPRRIRAQRDAFCCSVSPAAGGFAARIVPGPEPTTGVGACLRSAGVGCVASVGASFRFRRRLRHCGSSQPSSTSMVDGSTAAV